MPNFRCTPKALSTDIEFFISHPSRAKVSLYGYSKNECSDLTKEQLSIVKQVVKLEFENE